jgi:predicted amidohydrolase
MWGFGGRAQTMIDAPGNGTLLVATCQFPVSDDISNNGLWIRKQMKKARTKGAEVAHFSEGALSGYAIQGSSMDGFRDYDWDHLYAETRSIMRLADSLDLWVILGSAHQLSGKNKPHNSLYVINPDGEISERYDKRFCTSGDLINYSPGDHFSTFEINGVRCGLLICYDIRFPELYREYRRLGVDVIFQSFHNVNKTADHIHPKIMPVSLQTRAATNYFYISGNNSSQRHSWPSVFITPDGLIGQRLAANQPGVMINSIDKSQKFYDASRTFRMDCINGKLNSGKIVHDPRSTARTGF